MHIKLVNDKYLKSQFVRKPDSILDLIALIQDKCEDKCFSLIYTLREKIELLNKFRSFKLYQLKA